MENSHQIFGVIQKNEKNEGIVEMDFVEKKKNMDFPGCFFDLYCGRRSNCNANW